MMNPGNIGDLTVESYLLPLLITDKVTGAATVNCKPRPDYSTPASDGNIRIVLPQQTHTTNVGIVTDPDDQFPDTDALITQLPRVAVGIRTADCVPLLLHAPDIEAVAAIHAGWRGTIGGIVDNTVRELQYMGADPGKISAAFGIAVCGNCYEVDRELADRFSAEGFSEAVIETFQKPHIDLVRANTIRLERCGIASTNIRHTDLCTLHSVSDNGELLFHSWRRCPGLLHRNYTFIYLH